MSHPFESSEHGNDVQAILRSGFATLTKCRYLLLRIEDPEKAARWIDELFAEKLIKSVADIDFAKKAGGGFDEAVILAFTYCGLTRLGLTEHREFPFPTAFKVGMANPLRAPLIGDEQSERAHWNWTDVDTGKGTDSEVHVMAVHYQSDDPHNSPSRQFSAVSNSGFKVVKTVETCPFYVRDKSEPFGFQDGISQPYVLGLSSERVQSQAATNAGPDDDNTVAAGEFVLGHVNAYGERSYTPDLKGWRDFSKRDERFAFNGSYVAVRQIAQDVAAFKSAEQEYGKSAIEKMIGRTRKGEALVTDSINSDAASSPKGETCLNNSFRYRISDLDGFQCPRGAHIRRANPRDALGWDVESGVAASKLHRLIRRGRVYSDRPRCADNGEVKCVERSCASDCGNGLFFVALNADLDRQFEFVQQRWFSNPKFADLWDEADPALGAASSRSFSMPSYLPIGARLFDLPRFTTVIGGGYFFLPSISALRFIASKRDQKPNMNSIEDRRVVEDAQQWFEQSDIRVRPQPSSGVFEIGLSLAGTVSAGAYTAGVLDFLVEALDEWEQAKQDMRRSIARHNVRLKVISGTSGGGACAATLAKALAYRFPAEAITDGNQPPNPNSVNPLYRLWVYGFGVHDLCAVDAEERVEPLRSLLHEGPSTNDFEQFVSPKGERVDLVSRRTWVDNPLTVLLTLTNREGLSYTVSYVGNTERYRRHADYARFEFYYGDGSQHSPGWPDAFMVKANENAVLPKPAGGTAISWKDAWQFARATAAFPVLFPAVPLSRPAWQYLYQPLIIQSPSGPAEVLVWPPDGSGSQGGQENSHLSFSAIDGGVLNDHPAELAQHHLAGLVGRDRGEPEETTRALIHIDPFAGTLTRDSYKLSADNGDGETLVRAAAGAASALASQAQFSTQDFSLASEAAGRSRFLIGATRGADSGKAALASGALYAFSGFLSERFRQHDFMLGRRNCQQFLRTHFHLPSNNPLFGGNSLEAGDRPIIPLTGTAAVEQVLPAWPLASNQELPSDTGKPDVQSALRNRVGLVVERMLDQIGIGGRLMILLVAILPSVISARVLSSILFRRIVADLRKHRLVSS